jgi:hypothetical protein
VRDHEGHTGGHSVAGRRESGSRSSSTRRGVCPGSKCRARGDHGSHGSRELAGGKLLRLPSVPLKGGISDSDSGSDKSNLTHSPYYSPSVSPDSSTSFRTHSQNSPKLAFSHPVSLPAFLNPSPSAPSEPHLGSHSHTPFSFHLALLLRPIIGSVPGSSCRARRPGRWAEAKRNARPCIRARMHPTQRLTSRSFVSSSFPFVPIAPPLPHPSPSAHAV